jgi:hypothetical protein
LAVDGEAELASLIADIEPDSRSLGRAGGVDVRRREDPSEARLAYGVVSPHPRARSL